MRSPSYRGGVSSTDGDLILRSPSVGVFLTDGAAGIVLLFLEFCPTPRSSARSEGAFASLGVLPRACFLYLSFVLGL
ncbi:hypothetical protein Taro_028970 [Colocasia esculenta]|uniref:Uncharacterized protein n=1 Tax=Colocasia esculenta TaxID=4460 RepID=A0A843VHT5_COLES|nr:hypothetical protein [Colocasia esculenta]